MVDIDYFEQQARLLLRDYRVFKYNNFELSKINFLYPQEHFDIRIIMINFREPKIDTIMKARRYVAKMAEFDNWKRLTVLSPERREICGFKLNTYKIGGDPDLILFTKFIVHDRLRADYGFKYTDEKELKVWKQVIATENLADIFYNY